MARKKLLSQYHPALYFLSVWEKRIRRYIWWKCNKESYAFQKQNDKLPFRIKKHQSVLIRKLGDADLVLQYNKVENLKIAIQEINNILIKPGETFSFCNLVGIPTKRKGYKLGMELTFGEARAGIGGGLCQISNLLHWLVIHSPLLVTERYHHSFDPFPDHNRVLPFGSGATVFFNYRDYCFKNTTNATFQINLWLSEKCLEGELRCSKEFDFAYHVEEREHEFVKLNNQFYRKNEIWRNKIAKFKSGKVLETELVTKNFARVVYTPDTYREVTLEDLTEEQKAKM
ncbi:VanW family protein [Cytophagaceae bacterium YF14B1]|uniref:VanW family protein n=1 Tax=Xanthocytophaga flava TaxID=3048013 RepID=A0AAE3QVP0_9BACT|nr:VanW family protein [Xanthocytophaga flavus]MDJ1483413.1 VanW family protein [Xanthocytophaga flavus]